MIAYSFFFCAAWQGRLVAKGAVAARTRRGSRTSTEEAAAGAGSRVTHPSATIKSKKCVYTPDTCCYKFRLRSGFPL